MFTKYSIIAFFALPLVSGQAYSDECMSHARTALEKSYCAVKARGEGRNLPTLHVFRKNDERMQRLLLKNSAKKAGIKLPESRQANAPQNLAKEQQKAVSNPEKTQTTAQTNQNQGMDDCILEALSIRCANKVYTRQDNLQNYQLEIGALGAKNELHLADRQSREYQSASTHQYLSAMYQIYIQKMLDIGLGGATMSFTKFVTTYEEQQKNGTDSVKRFWKMYELLKQERKANGIKSRYVESFPQSISQCMRINATIIVCDDVKNNWVFSR